MKYDPEDPRITAYVFNELGDDEKQEFEKLLASSSELTQQVEQTRATISSLEAEFAADDQLSLNDHQRRTVRSEIACGSTPKVDAKNLVNSPEDADGRAFRTRFAFVCASVGVVVLAGVFLWPGTQQQIAKVSSPSDRPELYSHVLADGRGSNDSNDGYGTLMDLVHQDGATDKYAESGLHIESKQTVHDSGVQGLGFDHDGDGTLDGNPMSNYGFALEDSGAVVDFDFKQPSVPFGEEGPVTYPAPTEFSSLSERRKAKYSKFDLASNASNAQKLKEEGLSPLRIEVVELKVGLDDFEEAMPMGLPELAVVEMRGRQADRLRNFSFFVATDRGEGPGQGGDKYEHIVENDFLRVTDTPLSTFSIDVDTASYAKVRMYLTEHEQLPRPDAVRIEELVNYFPYQYMPPTDEHPFAAHQSVATCPWNPKHQLVRIGIKGKEMETDRRPSSNLVFLLDVSGSMDEPNKLPLVKRGMKMLTNRLMENDRVAIVVYAGAAGLVLDSTTGDNKSTILEALDHLQAGGSTNGGQGIELAYETALKNFISGGVNRVILCTDGDFNVGTTGTDELIRKVEEQAKKNVFLSVLGFGMGNHNDSMLEQVSNKGNGNYGFVDSTSEARKVFVEQMSGTLVTIAKDVKIQIEFNPKKVSSYRLIGYENRVMAAKDFNDDTKDAGEIGAGHTVTALYELVPVGAKMDLPKVDELKYQTPATISDAAEGDELFTLKLRYKQPDGDKSELLVFPCKDVKQAFHEADRDFQFAAAVASFGMLLRGSKYKGDATFASVLETASAAVEEDEAGYRQEFLHLVQKASHLAGETKPEGEPEATDDHGDPILR